MKSWNVTQPNGRKVCVHAFLDTTGVYQTLPFDYQGWHAGGNANNELIGFEICEPRDYSDKEYFSKIKAIVLDFCEYLCKKYNLTAESVTSHCEAYQRRGKYYASNHSDVDHWWKKHFNYTMDDFRKDLKERLEKGKNIMDFKTGKEALDYLVSKEKIVEPEYWIKVLDTTKNIDYLLIKWAKDVAEFCNNKTIPPEEG